MKEKIKLVINYISLGLVVVILFISLFDRKTYAVTAPKYGAELIGGLGEYGETDRYWYFNGSSPYYYSCAKNAMDMWENKETNNIADYISFVNTRDELLPSIVITASAVGKKVGYNGCTSHTLNRGSVYPNYSDWDTAYITYNTTNGIVDSSVSYLVSAVMAHEIGHAFGLDEYNSNKNSIMCQWNYGRVAIAPTSNDIWSAICVYKGSVK